MTLPDKIAFLSGTKDERVSELEILNSEKKKPKTKIQDKIKAKEGDIFFLSRQNEMKKNKERNQSQKKEEIKVKIPKIKLETKTITLLKSCIMWNIIANKKNRRITGSF